MTPSCTCRVQNSASVPGVVVGVPVQKSNILEPDREPYSRDLDLGLYKRLGFEKVTDEIRRCLWEACKQDPDFYIFNFCRTFDPKNQHEPVRPFPDKPHLHKALAGFLDIPDQIAAMVKSRQMTLSWLVCAYCTWVARFGDHRHVPIQVKNKDDADEFVFNGDWFSSRCAFIEYAMPQVLWVPGQIVGKQGRLVYPKGSYIRAVTQGKNVFRGGAFSFAIIDEACFVQDFGDTYAGALASVKGGGRMRMFSTAKYGTEFGDVIEAQDKMAA